MEMMRIALTIDRSSTCCFPVKLHLLMGLRRIKLRSDANLLSFQSADTDHYTITPMHLLRIEHRFQGPKPCGLSITPQMLYESIANRTQISGLKVRYSTIELWIRELEENRTPTFLVKSQVLFHLATSPYPHLWIYPFLWIYIPLARFALSVPRFKAEQTCLLSYRGWVERCESNAIKRIHSPLCYQYITIHIRNLPESNRPLHLCRVPHLPLCQDFYEADDRIRTDKKQLQAIYDTISSHQQKFNIVLTLLVDVSVV